MEPCINFLLASINSLLLLSRTESWAGNKMLTEFNGIPEGPMATSLYRVLPSLGLFASRKVVD
jgi:hypothetical protein